MNNVNCVENEIEVDSACKIIKESVYQQELLKKVKYSYKILPGNPREQILIKEGEQASAYCLSAFNYYIQNEFDFEQALASGKHHPITGSFSIGDLATGEDLMVYIDDVIPFYDRIWCITRSAGVLHRCFNLLGNTASERAFKIYSPKRSFPNEPMVGFVGTEPHRRTMSSGRGWSHGGNLDLPCIKKGSIVILPAGHRRAGVWFGDIHVTQGWGELAGVALECSGLVKFRINRVKLIQKTKEPIIIVPKKSGLYDLYFVGCRNSFRQAILAAAKNTIRFYPAWNAYGFIDAYCELGIHGNIVIGQAVGKTVSVAIRIQTKDINHLYK
jgi:acetamidase/formamidase